jgi:hypothetical protein
MKYTVSSSYTEINYKYLHHFIDTSFLLKYENIVKHDWFFTF